MWPVFFYHSNHFQFLRATAKGLKCQMQMQLLKYLDSWCRLVFFFCLSFMLSVGFQASISLSVAVCPQGLNTLVSLTSITFAGLCVSLSLSASQKHLQHKDHIVSLTIRCLNFERLLLTLPHTERKAAKISTIFKVE